jgi:probable rRNA maturation factor
MSILLMIEEPKWRRKRGLSTRIKRAAELARTKGGNAEGALTILLASDRELKVLNTTFRGKDKATNVLSFPARQRGYLGDVAIAYGVTEKEARAQKKSFSDHALHLTVHGVLHLLGYDHETARAARVMEPLETAILDELGIDDPYASEAA